MRSRLRCRQRGHISSPKPLYVLELDPVRNRVVVGDETLLERDSFVIERCNWIPFQDPPESIEVSAKIRYNHPGTPATVTPWPGGKARVKLHEAQRAITPGQACVLYDGDLVVGGGWIRREPAGQADGAGSIPDYQSKPPTPAADLAGV